MEVPVAYFIRRTRHSRRAVALTLGTVIFLVGLPASLGYSTLADVKVAGRNILELYDFGVANFLLPLGGIATALFTGWGWGRVRALAGADLHDSATGKIWLFCLRFIAPVFIAIAFFSNSMVLE